MDDRSSSSVRQGGLAAQVKSMTLIWEAELVLLAVLSDVAGNPTGKAPPQSMSQSASKFHLCSSSRLFTSSPCHNYTGIYANCRL
jgi:hypothetical protein